VEVLHFVGAEASFVANEFQKHFLIISLKGSGAGSALAAIFFLLAFAGSRARWQRLPVIRPPPCSARSRSAGSAMSALR
jgi:hypothetical protein